MLARSRWTLVATILGSSMTFIDATVVNVALPALQADLQATITDVPGFVKKNGSPHWTISATGSSGKLRK